MKSLLNQSRQIRSSNLFANIELGTENVDRNTLAEGQSSLEGDLNVLRSLIKDITGGSLFSDSPKVTLFDVEKTTSKMLIQPIQIEATSVSGSSFVTALDVSYTNTLVTSDIGYIVDDSGTPSVSTKAKVLIRSKANNSPLLDSNENRIYAVASNDGADKVKLSFYVDVDGVATPARISGDIEAILPYRQKIANLNENALMGNAGFAGSIGAFEIGDRVYVEGTDSTGNPIFGFVEDENITDTINKIAVIGAATKTLSDNVSSVTGITSDSFATSFATEGANYLADGDSLLDAIVKLDTETKILEEAVSNSSGSEVAEILIRDLPEGLEYNIPNNKTYLNTDVDSIQLFVNGQKLVSDLAIGDGSAGNGDFTAFSNSTVKFSFPLEIGDVITAVIFKE